MVEVEAKAPVANADVEALRRVLEKRFGAGRAVVKSDNYYCHKGNPDIRCRLIGSVTADFSDAPDVISVPDVASMPGAPSMSSIAYSEMGGSACLLTTKFKQLRCGVECNKEIEFSMPSAEVAQEFLAAIKYKPYITKQKRGWAWASEPLLYELVEVPPLGWFLEIECVLDGTYAAESLTATAEVATPPTFLAETARQQIEARQRDKARQRVVAAFAELGIAEDQFESRYYTHMLAASLGRNAPC